MSLIKRIKHAIVDFFEQVAIAFSSGTHDL
jgi:hypothetical protein